MLGKIRFIIDKILDGRASSEISKKVTLLGKNYIFRRSSVVYLLNGSSKEDIIIGENVWMDGSLMSQNGGKIILGNNVKTGVNCLIGASNKIVIGDYTAIADNTRIIDNNYHPINPLDRKFMRLTPENSKYRGWKYADSAPIIIGENCWIGEYSRILKGVTIGDNSIVAANAVVTKDVPKNCIAAGNPARIVKQDIDKLPRVINDELPIE